MGSPKNTPSPPLKGKAPFQEMILEKNPDKSETVINTSDCFTHKKTLGKDDRYSTKNVNFFDVKKFFISFYSMLLKIVLLY